MRPSSAAPRGREERLSRARKLVRCGQGAAARNSSSELPVGDVSDIAAPRYQREGESWPHGQGAPTASRTAWLATVSVAGRKLAVRPRRRLAVGELDKSGGQGRGGGQHIFLRLYYHRYACKYYRKISKKESPTSLPSGSPNTDPDHSRKPTSAVGERGERHAVVALAHPELVCPAVSGVECAGRRSACALQGARAHVERERGHRAVDDVVLTTVWIAIAPARGAVGRRVNVGFDGQAALSGQRKRAAGGALRDLQPARAEPAEARPSTVQRDRSARHPRREASSHEHPPKRHVQPRRGVLLETDPMQPDPALGVLGAPVVPHHAPPSAQLQRAVGQLDRAVEARRRGGARELGARQRGLVEPGLLEVAKFGLIRVEAQRPARRAARALGDPRPEARVCADLYPAAGWRRELGGGALVHERRSGGGVEHRAPQRTARGLPGSLVDGVADPRSDGLLR